MKSSVILDRTYVSHLAYVGDSVIGSGCELGAGVITANLRFDGENVKVHVKRRLMDTGMQKFGAIIGDDVKVGVNVSILPGRKIGVGSWVWPGVVVADDIPSGRVVRLRQKVETSRRGRRG